MVVAGSATRYLRRSNKKSVISPKKHLVAGKNGRKRLGIFRREKKQESFESAIKAHKGRAQK